MFNYILFILAVISFIIGRYLVGILYLVMAYAGYMANRRTSVLISKDGIQYPAFRLKKIRWNEVENAMLKDGILTIDLYNNKLYQFLVNDLEEAASIQEEFNNFSKEMMAGSAHPKTILN